jgi:hypothetical protein
MEALAEILMRILGWLLDRLRRLLDRLPDRDPYAAMVAPDGAPDLGARRLSGDPDPARLADLEIAARDWSGSSLG